MSVPSNSELQNSHFSYESLRRTTDIKKWLNGVLSSPEKDYSPDKISPALSITAAEQAVRSVLSNVEMHSQQLAATVESHISQSITRLPRTALELSRMVSEAHELQQQMQLMETLVSSSSDCAYFSRLNEYKIIQNRLHTCATIIARAKEVDQRIKDLDSLQSVKQNEYDKQRLDDVSQLAEKLYAVKHGLCEIRQVEPEFGSHFNMVLDQYEQLIQDALEEQCLFEFVAHDDKKAADLFASLYRIGRSSAVLQRYNEHVSKVFSERGCPKNLLSPGGSLPLFSVHFIKTISDMLSTEALFWLRLSVYLDNFLLFSNEKSKDDTSRCEFAFTAVKNLLDSIFCAAKLPIIAAVELANNCAEILDFLNSARAITLDLSGGDLPKSYQEKIEIRLKEMIINVLSDSKVIKQFSIKTTKMIHDRLSDTQSNFSQKSDRIATIFTLTEKVVCEASLMVLAFFPNFTVEESVPQWYEVLYRIISSLEAPMNADHACVLDSLTIFVKQIQPAIHNCKVAVENCITTRYSEGQEYLSFLQEKLNLSLWARLGAHIESYIQKCHQMVRNWILAPLIDKTAEYHTLSVWVMNGEQANATYDQHISATKPVKELGEAIIEIPVTLENIRVMGMASASNKIYMEEVIEDFYDAWLDDVVYSAVVDFVERKVLPLRFHSSTSSTASSHTDQPSRFVTAWEQLRSDIGYLRNVVAAVRDNGVEILDKVHDQLQRNPPPSSSNVTVQGALFPPT